ncbi:MAG: hypothetical protein R3Y24_05435 [Eubacteriales bacterium]
MKIVISQKIIEKEAMGDIALYMNRLMQNIEGDVYIIFEPDTYEFKAKYAYEEFCYITNNDYSLKQIAFPIIRKNNIAIDGNGSLFMMTGRMMPFWIKDSKNIVLKNFSIDYKRPLFSQGIVEEASKEHVRIKIDKTVFPFEIEQGIVHFVGEDYDESHIHGFLEYDTVKKGPIVGAVDTFPRGIVKASEPEEGVLEVRYPFARIADVGSMMTIKHEKRFVPGIAMDNSEQILLEGLQIKQAGTMAIVAQFCDTVTLEKIKVATNKDSVRVVSSNADATHFVGCRGVVTVQNCLFESQLDDAFNVHGNYLVVDKILSTNSVVIQIGHFQQEGIFGLEPGGTIEILDRNTMLGVGCVTLQSKQVLNKKYAILTFKETFDFIEGNSYCIDDCDSYPEVIFRRNVVQNNRARGILLTSRKKTVIDNNIFKTEGAAIKISGDMNFWFESGGCCEVIIRENHLESTCNKEWGHALIDIDPEMEELVENKFYHKLIRIESNTIVMNGWPLTYARSIEKLVIKDNEIIDVNETCSNKLPLHHEGIGSLDMN